MTLAKKIEKAVALLESARKDIEKAEELLADHEGLTDTFSDIDNALTETFELLEEAQDDLDEDED